MTDDTGLAQRLEAIENKVDRLLSFLCTSAPPAYSCEGGIPGHVLASQCSAVQTIQRFWRRCQMRSS
eukprot:5839009-Karenia_brevis.AAC.1